jgi:formylmethanofuran dehydrogenase subunit E
MPTFEELLQQTAVLHHHLCPRQVLGVRMGLYAGRLLGLELPQTDKRLLVIMETDGCGADGVSVATNCWTGRRTMRIVDYGKMAATFVDTRTETAVRIAPLPSSRAAALACVPGARSPWHAYLEGYQLLPDTDLFSFQPVTLRQEIRQIMSFAGRRATCAVCGEEILNEREVRRDGRILCRACAGTAYYAPAAAPKTADS